MWAITDHIFPVWEILETIFPQLLMILGPNPLNVGLIILRFSWLQLLAYLNALGTYTYFNIMIWKKKQKKNKEFLERVEIFVLPTMIGRIRSSSPTILKNMLGFLDLYKILPLGGTIWLICISLSSARVMKRCPWKGKMLTTKLQTFMKNEYI